MEPDGLDHGVTGPPTNVPFSKIWLALVDKITHPGSYIPGVESVSHRPNTDGSTYREITLAGGPTMTENIYALEDRKRVEYWVIDKDWVVVNQWLEDEKAILYVLENRKGEVLGWMKGMREGTYQTILTQYALAEKGFDH